MEDVIVLINVINNYIDRQSDGDRYILNLLIRDECKEYEISRITGYSISKISRVIRKLRSYLRKFDYN